MATPFFAFTILQRQYALLGPKFVARYPHDWLIWEAGPWRPAPTREARDTERTRLPDSAGPARPPGEDAFCFVLDPTRQPLRVGRATTNDLVINDLTASRDQFVLTRTGGRWLLESHNPSARLDGRGLTDEPAPLSHGSHLVAGGVSLRFVAANEMPMLLARNAGLDSIAKAEHG